MKPHQFSYLKHFVFAVVASTTLVACVGSDHMTEQEARDTLLTCEQMFGPEKCQ